MTGFDEKALNWIMEKYEGNEKQANEVFSLALTYDVDFMVSAGIIADNEFTDEYYDEDDAFDFIVEHIAQKLPSLDGNVLTELVETYIDLHDAYMEEIGLLSWE